MESCFNVCLSLRKFLRAKEMFQSLIYLEEACANIPDSAQFALNAADAQFLAKQPETP